MPQRMRLTLGFIVHSNQTLPPIMIYYYKHIMAGSLMLWRIKDMIDWHHVEKEAW